MLLCCLIRSRKTMHLGKTLRFKKIASDAWHVGTGSAIIDGVCCGSRAAVAGRRMAQPVYAQFRKWSVYSATCASCHKRTREHPGHCIMSR